MIKGIVKKYNENKLSFIQKMSESEDGVFFETEFLDDSAIASRINKLKKEFKRVSEDIIMLSSYDKKDSYNLNKFMFLMDKKNKISIDIAFLASNSLNNLESCEKILSDIDTDFKKCIEALKHYKIGNYEKSFDTFFSYFKDRSYVIDHYLINKLYGFMLYEHKQYNLAIVLLRKAVEKKPEDIEIHKALRELYSIVSLKEEKIVEQNIIGILEA